MAKVKKTSSDWYEQYFKKVKIIDPDGWDRSNWEYSWYQEPITKEEFRDRLTKSSIQILVPIGEFNLDV
jgi:hypothetical protein